ncbi:MAG: non-canonical purine NTP diphosphatase [Tannerella sp.]|jgi:XTP/dITP diphosphohydrolase|nr:non-canonical purine NTP diphosphatase [Tannerella sp.]
MKKIVFATNNEHKLKEVRAIMPPHIEVVGLSDLNFYDTLAETADTFAGNALQKARFVRQAFGCDCFADDTGLEVDALGGAPGVYSARYAGEAHDSQANTQKLLQNLSGITDRKARFKTVVALILSDKEYLFEGIINGQITESGRGTAGFGYDPVFIPDNYPETFAELGDDIKNNISHRAQAVQKLAEFLSSIYE